jgi:hypothetical protein
MGRKGEVYGRGIVTLVICTPISTIIYKHTFYIYQVYKYKNIKYILFIIYRNEKNLAFNRRIYKKFFP